MARGAGRCRIAVVQADAAPGRPEVNLERALGFMARAAGQGASLVVFPEMYVTGYAVWDRLEDLGVGPRAPVFRRLTAEARRLGVWTLIGYPERRGGRLYNAVALVNPHGALLPAYRKVHLYGREARHFSPGQRYRLFRMPGLTVGCLVCYDFEFPEAARALALAGVDLVAVCMANMEPFRPAQDVYARARALENQVFVAIANRVGTEDHLRFVGGSGVWDPSGRALVTADREEALLTATLDLRARAAARRRLDYLADRRPETYRRPVTPGRLRPVGGAGGSDPRTRRVR
jgi:5-aminopentanamidase